MLTLEIILVVIGLGAVILSYKMWDYAGHDRDSLPENETGTAKEEDVAGEKQEEYLNQLEEAKEEALQAAADELSHLSNDKLMGMDEYSSQVLDKISKNHEEVVFLYNMLTEKEEEMKQLVRHVDAVKAQVNEESAEEYRKMTQLLKAMEKKSQQISRAIQEQTVSAKKQNVTPKDQESMKEIYDKEIAAIEKAEEMEQEQKTPYFPKESSQQDQKKAKDKNHNEEIVDLYKKGHSVLEISRMLSLGQGEVKFVIDLYELH